MAKAQKATSNGKGKTATKVTDNDNRPVSAEDLAALGFAPEASKSLGGSKYPTISVEKIGFQIKSEAGIQAPASFEGIILHEHPMRTFYADKNAGNKPPDCYSVDGATGSVYGACHTCPHRYQAVANAARAQGLQKPAEEWCRDKHAVYVALEVGKPAYLLRLPTMSLSRWQLFIQGLQSQGKHFAQVWTTFSVTTRKNAGGIQYGEVNFLPGKPVALAMLKEMAPQAKMLREAQPAVAQLPESVGSAAQDDDKF